MPEFDTSGPIPVIILGGSDRKPGPVPPGLNAADMLTGYKGTQRLPWGRCLAAELVERLRASGRFADPVLIGPRRLYEGEVDCEIVNVRGNLVKTLRRMFSFIRQRIGLASPVAVSTCDILPTPDELAALLDTAYAPHQDCMFWWQWVDAATTQMGASAWKPAYPIRPAAGQPYRNLYPGHLVIARPEALRIGLTKRMLQLLYRYRNRELRRRPYRIVGRLIRSLMARDCRNLLRGKLPMLSVEIPYHGLRGYYKLKHQQLTLPEFEYHAGRIFLHRDYYHRAEGRPVVFSTTSILAMAKDIDTKAELAEAGAQQQCVSG